MTYAAWDTFRGVVGVDVETASALPIENGAWAYSLHDTTRVWCVCFAYAENASGARMTEYEEVAWVPGEDLPHKVSAFIRAGGTLVAHNANFERAIWANILSEAHGFPPFTIEQWRDTMVMAGAINLPQSLDGLSNTLSCATVKDRDGAKLMKEMAVPRRVPFERDGETGEALVYEKCHRKLARLIQYCHADVRATLECYFKLPKLSVTEQRLALADAKIGMRGVYLDQRFADQCARLVDLRSRSLVEQTTALTNGELKDASKPLALKVWLTQQGVKLPKVRRKRADGSYHDTETADKGAVSKLLDDPTLPSKVRRVLQLKEEAAKATSLAKLKRVPLMVGHDGRLRFALRIYGAHTGRWSSSGLQIHNLPKDKRDDENQVALERSFIQRGDLYGLELVSKRPLESISWSLRSVIAAPPGRDIIAADYSAIEARCIAWLAGQDDLLGQFEQGNDVYVYTANTIGSKDRSLGKVASLALGYGMGALKFVVTAANGGVTLDPTRAFQVHKRWREANAAIVSFWHELEDCCRRAVLRRGRVFACGVGGAIAAQVQGGCLFVRLPSGRSLRYWKPRIVQTVKRLQVLREDGDVETIEIESDELRFVTAKGARMVEESTYSGKLAENVTQAVARELLAAAVPRIEDVDPYEVVMHVHDSIAAEVPSGAGSVEEFSELMAELPAWAKGLPNAVEGYRAPYFKG